jgi:hypothetical protein
LVVVIVGAVICGVAYATIRRAESTKTEPKHRTAWEPQAFTGGPSPAPGSTGWSPASREPEAALEPLAPPPRARAAVLLCLWVVLIGATSAAVVGLVTFVGAHLANKALGS